jgi:hypothetical protein
LAEQSVAASPSEKTREGKTRCCTTILNGLCGEARRIKETCDA